MSTGNPDIERVVREVFEKRIPFNQVLGLQIESMGGAGPTDGGESDDRVVIGFPFRDELVGNFVRQALHGGVTSAALDTVGGLAAFLDLMHRTGDLSQEERIARLGKVGTIDLRVDYLRSGLGKHFHASGWVLRSGSRVVVTRMELHNEANTLLAAGTGTYIVG